MFKFLEIIAFLALIIFSFFEKNYLNVVSVVFLMIAYFNWRKEEILKGHFIFLNKILIKKTKEKDNVIFEQEEVIKSLNYIIEDIENA